MRSPESSSRSATVRILLVLVGVLLPAACAHKQKPRTIAIVPVDVLGMPGDHGEELEKALATEITKQPHNHLADREEIRRALPAESPAPPEVCTEADSCLIAVGKRVAADLVLSVRLAGLGDTHVLRARLFDVERGILVKDLQETGAGGQAALAGHARAVSRRLFPPPRKPSRWWLWTAAAAAIAATATVAIVTREDNAGIIHVGDL
jgi:hypothetical protein